VSEVVTRLSGCPDADKLRAVFAWAGGQCVNKEMVKRGAAWFNSEYSNGAELFEEENAARDGKRELWALPREKRREPWGVET
jgi:endonuclease YncB( thermonuclease family)